MKSLTQKGFTLIEVLIVIALIGIMLAVAGYYMGGQGKKAQLKSAARDLVSNMNLARTKAIRDSKPWTIQFNPATNSYRLIDGDGGTFRTITLPANVSFGSNLTPVDSKAIGDGVSYINDRVIFNPNGTSSDFGAAYFTVFNDASLANTSFAVSSLAATGRVKFWRNFGTGWSF